MKPDEEPLSQQVVRLLLPVCRFSVDLVYERKAGCDSAAGATAADFRRTAAANDSAAGRRTGHRFAWNPSPI
jgi:hypothetical protein